MRKRALQAGLIICAIIASVTLWARQGGEAAPSETPAQIEQRVQDFLRAYYAWGSAFQIKVEQPQPSPVADLYQVPVEVTYQGQSDAALVYVTHDGHYVLRGTIDSLIGNPYAANIQKLDVTGHPALGPAKACVNVVEFSDFECPHCLEAHTGIEKIEPQYPQVRFTFMDYPLKQVHPWAMTAALAGRCAYQENPESYFKLQNLIFDNQNQITPDDAFTKLVALGTEAGLNAATLQACISSPAAKKLVDDDIALGNELHVNSTPTIFVNGRPMVGWDPQLYQQFVSYELAQCPAGHQPNLPVPTPGSPRP